MDIPIPQTCAVFFFSHLEVLFSEPVTEVDTQISFTERINNLFADRLMLRKGRRCLIKQMSWNEKSAKKNAEGLLWLLILSHARLINRQWQSSAKVSKYTCECHRHVLPKQKWLMCQEQRPVWAWCCDKFLFIFFPGCETNAIQESTPGEKTVWIIEFF